MKLSLKCMALLVAAGMFFIACEKESDDGPMDKYFEAEYADKDSVEVKQDLEQTGVDMQETMDQLQQEEAIDVTANLVDLLANSSLFDDLNGFVPADQLASIQNGKMPEEGMVMGLKSASEDPESLEEAWNMLVGEYTYDAELDSFVKSENTDAIIINFPGLEGGTNNDAVLTVSNFSVFNPTEPVPSTEETIPELPASLNVELTYGDNAIPILTSSFEGSYEANGVPKLINYVLEVGAFDLVYKVEHNPYSKATIIYSLKYNDEIVVEMYGESNGDWSEQNIEDNIVTIEESNEFGSWEYQEFYFENVLNNANSYIQVMNVKVAGAVNIKELAAVMRPLDENENITEEEYAQQSADAINDNGKLVVVYADSNEKIAMAEAYPKQYTYVDEWCNFVEGSGWEACEEIYWGIGVNMIFADGSKVDAETYLTEVFDSMAQDLDDFFAFLDQF